MLNVNDIQLELKGKNLDGWLLYDFRRTNDLACQFLEIDESRILTRRFFYWIPKSGEPVKLVHAIESQNLKHLPGKTIVYQTQKEIEKEIPLLLSDSKRIAMEYSPMNAIPAVSKVDAGTMDLVRTSGVEVVSSADLMQKYSVWDEHKLKTHLAAAEVLDQTVDKTWKFIAQSLKNGNAISEYDVQQFILKEIADMGCVTADSSICAINAHSADPHYCADKDHSEKIKAGDFILLDLWCKQDLPRAVYADITRVGVAANRPSQKQKMIFNRVKWARDAATNLVKERMGQGQPLTGSEVDKCCRDLITEAGYGKFFVHRTGHNIDEQDHGNGTHIDSFETNDTRQIVPGTCFSIEPGIYLPGEFGVRLEYDVYVHLDRKVMITGGVQDEITSIISY